ncbi:MAG TPA: hypothetical protein PKE26_09735 [Kiritimatiellia bacterium]|nr:hypothetical protein [Kiritimatiellia bacterium]HMO99377.1 hypothetical protein [Kiritimatiellia bacterium]HMP96500.1 hypothetical protein [Kiritimatiellia bacterium]
MKRVAILLNAMIRDEVITSYAVFGAVAQMRYTEAVSTMDADILVGLEDGDPLTLLSPIYRYCQDHGYHPEGEAIRVGDWPVQFIPVYDELTSEALRLAEQGDLDGEPLWVVRADYLAVIALKTARTKDYLRISALLEADAVAPEDIARLASKHDLDAQWDIFRRRFL